MAVIPKSKRFTRGKSGALLRLSLLFASLSLLSCNHGEGGASGVGGTPAAFSSDGATSVPSVTSSARRDAVTPKDAYTPVELSKKQEEEFDPRVLPLVQEFVVLVNRRMIPALPITHLRSIRVVRAGELSAMLAGHPKRHEAMALTLVPRSQLEKKLDIEMFISEDILGERAELKGFVFHELLHVIGYDHPPRPCTWRECGILGASPWDARLTVREVDAIIEKTLTARFLKKYPKLKFAE